jgi:hypothetical protein
MEVVFPQRSSPMASWRRPLRRGPGATAVRGPATVQCPLRGAGLGRRPGAAGRKCKRRSRPDSGRPTTAGAGHSVPVASRRSSSGPFTTATGPPENHHPESHGKSSRSPAVTDRRRLGSPAVRIPRRRPRRGIELAGRARHAQARGGGAREPRLGRGPQRPRRRRCPLGLAAPRRQSPVREVPSAHSYTWVGLLALPALGLGSL